MGARYSQVPRIEAPPTSYDDEEGEQGREYYHETRYILNDSEEEDEDEGYKEESDHESGFVDDGQDESRYGGDEENPSKRKAASKSNNESVKESKKNASNSIRRIPSAADDPSNYTLDQEILDFYRLTCFEEMPPSIRHGPEAAKQIRRSAYEELERERIRDILQRYMALHQAKGLVVEIGCGNGNLGVWLAENSQMEVLMIDPIQKNVEFANKLAARRKVKNRANAVLGEARRLAIDSESAACVILPVYHLLTRDQRRRALVEAYRALKDGGLLLVNAMSRFSFTISALFGDLLLENEEYTGTLFEELDTGKHCNPTKNPSFFCSAFTHKPNQLKSEIVDAGFVHKQIIAVEGPIWLLGDLEESWSDPRKRPLLLQVLRKIETEPSLLGCSANWVAVARKPVKG